LGEDPKSGSIFAFSNIEDVLTRLPAMKASEGVTLTPAAWLKACGGKAKGRA